MEEDAQNNAEEEYIELEVISSSNSTISLFHFKANSPPQEPRLSEFEFQMLPSNFINSKDTNNSISTADELFYNGKILPLHLPFRLQMLENILHNPSKKNKSLHISRSFDDQENYLFGYSTDDEIISRKSKWTTRKLRVIKNLSFDSKIKSSKSYLKCLINNSVKLVALYQRKSSFSGAIKRIFLTSKSSSSSSSCGSSNNSNGNIQDVHSLYYSEVEDENPIQAAIAHCKNSQQQKE